MFNFGVPVARPTVFVEKYSFPVITILGRDPEAIRTTFRFRLNGAALDALKITDDSREIAFAFVENDSFISNVTGQNLPKGVSTKLNKDGECSSKNYHSYLCKKYELDQSVDNDFALVLTEIDGVTLYKFAPISEQENEIPQNLEEVNNYFAEPVEDSTSQTI